jgi:hypothetical protein
MAKAFGPQIKKLQKAINEKYDAKILINKTQYYSEKSDRPLELLIIKKAVWNAEKQKFMNIEVFSSASDVQIVLWLRDYWYELNGWEIPTDNEEWNTAKKKYEEKISGKK